MAVFCPASFSFLHVLNPFLEASLDFNGTFGKAFDASPSLAAASFNRPVIKRLAAETAAKTLSVPNISMTESSFPMCRTQSFTQHQTHAARATYRPDQAAILHILQLP